MLTLGLDHGYHRDHQHAEAPSSFLLDPDKHQSRMCLGFRLDLGRISARVALRPETDGAPVRFRLLFGSATVACLVLGFVAMQEKGARQHSAWMTRGYVIGFGAGTKVLIQVPFLSTARRPPGVLAVAEWLIRRQLPARSPPGQPLAANGGAT